MPFCGEKYKPLIRTGEGRTPEDPCGWYCNLGNWEDWQAAMEGMMAKALSKHAELQRQAIAAGRTDVTSNIERLYLGPAQNAYAAAMAIEPGALDSMPGDADISAAIGKAIEAMDMFACAIEQIDGGYVELGLTVPETPGAVTAEPPGANGDDWMDWAKKAGIAMGVGLFGYLVIRYWLSRRLMAAPSSPQPEVIPHPPTQPPPRTENWRAA